MSTVSRTWTDPIANLDLAAGQKVSEANWDAGMSNSAYLGNTVEPATFTNKSGGALSAGAVVVMDTANATSFKTSTTLADPRVLGVVVDASIASNGVGRVACLGPVATVNVQGNVAIGDFLAVSTTAGRAVTVTNQRFGAFAIATSSYGGGGAGTVSAILLSGAPTGSVVTTTFLAAQFDVAASTALVNVTGLNQAIGANEKWLVQWFMPLNCAAAGGSKWACTVPAGATLQFFGLTNISSTLNSNSGQTTTSGTAIIGATAAQTYAQMFATVLNGATAGSIQLQFAQNAASGTSSILINSMQIAFRNA